MAHFAEINPGSNTVIDIIVVRNVKLLDENGEESEAVGLQFLRDTMENGENVYLRGFGTFVVKKRAEKTGRNISKNTTLIIPEHYVPSFKPSKSFVNGVKKKVKK